MIRDHLKLQVVLILWGVTAVLGALIMLPAPEIVAFRTAIASVILGVILRKRLLIPMGDALKFTVTGFVIGAHWVTFFLAVKIANVSICMVGIATLSLWTAILEPLFVRGRRFRLIDLLFGTVVIIGVALIYRGELKYSSGFLIALLSAFLAGVFSVINSFHIKKSGPYLITFYEMMGACLFAAATLLFLPGERDLVPSLHDWFYLFLLGGLCTVVAFSEYVNLLKRFSLFAINFASNLEPIYGILLAAFILKDYKDLGPGFYAGASVIILAILCYPVVRRLFTKAAAKE